MQLLGGRSGVGVGGGVGGSSVLPNVLATMTDGEARASALELAARCVELLCTAKYCLCTAYVLLMYCLC